MHSCFMSPFNLIAQLYDGNAQMVVKICCRLEGCLLIQPPTLNNKFLNFI